MPSPPAATVGSVQCSACQVTSVLPELFHRVVVSTAGRLLCPACWLKHRARIGIREIQAVCLVGAVGLLIQSEFRWILLGFAVGSLMLIALTPLHELAHAAMAFVLGVRVYRFQIGWFGRQLLHFHIGRCLVEVRSVPLGGLVQVAHRTPRLARIKQMMVVAAGPAVHLGLVLGAGSLRTSGPLEGWTDWWTNVVLLGNLAALFVNLFPSQHSSPNGPVPNDGLQLLMLMRWSRSEAEQQPLLYYCLECLDLRRRRNFEAALAVCAEGDEQFPNRLPLRMCRGLCEIDLSRFEAARQTFLDFRGNPEVTPAADAILLNNVAWVDLLTGDPSLLTEAGECSARAFQAIPWVPEIKGTRGSVLIEQGEVSEGMELVRQALEDNEDHANKALNAAFLALGYVRQGAIKEAQAMSELSRRWDRRCPLSERVLREMAEASVT